MAGKILSSSDPSCSGMIAASLFRGLAGPTGAATVRKDSSAATTPANVQTMQNRNSMFKCSCVAVRQETRL
ncbi:MAG: hypothetical protein MUE50_15100, partial [Pirellulaceae bacterium]|nr:hypothetical protein [Pirellulaceae bacterium]